MEKSGIFKSKIILFLLLLYLSIMLFFLGGWSPLVFFAALPFIVIGCVFGANVLWVSIIAGSIITGIIADSLWIGGLFFVEAGGVGFLMFTLLKSNKSGWKIIGLTTLIALLLNALLFIILLAIKDIDFPARAQMIITQATEKIIEFSKSRGAGEKEIVQLQEFSRQMHWLLLSLWPALTISSVWICIYFVYNSTVYLLKYFGFTLEKRLFFSRWRCPEWLVWVLIISSGILVGRQNLQFFSSQPLYIFILNVFILISYIYFLQGLSVTAFFFQVTKVKPVMRVIFYTLLLLQGIFWLVLALVGLLDQWVNWRRFAKQ